jgi:hypothetical protein
MAKSKKPTKKIGGPFLTAAILCENILEDQSQMLSALHILDVIHLWVPENLELPTKEHPAEISLNMLIMLKTGDAPGRYKVQLVIESPTGKRKEAPKQPLVKLPRQANAGANIKVKFGMKVFTSGVFWIDVMVDGKRLTRVPLDIQIKRPEKQLPSRTT